MSTQLNPETLRGIERAREWKRMVGGPHYHCQCGYRFDLTLGAYGCPNCAGMMRRAIRVPPESWDEKPAPAPAPVKVRGYGCHNRKPITTVCAPTCQYTYSALGQRDARCWGCKERVDKASTDLEPGRIMSDAASAAAIRRLSDAPLLVQREMHGTIRTGHTP